MLDWNKWNEVYRGICTGSCKFVKFTDIKENAYYILANCKRKKNPYKGIGQSFLTHRLRPTV